MFYTNKNIRNIILNNNQLKKRFLDYKKLYLEKINQIREFNYSGKSEIIIKIDEYHLIDKYQIIFLVPNVKNIKMGNNCIRYEIKNCCVISSIKKNN
jgi:hypothetical protein